MSVLIQFLHRAAYVALSSRSAPLTFVMGNEGGDIDSVISAIYTSLLYSKNWDSPTFIPILNFPRDDLRLRGDIWSMLRDHGVTESDLLFEEHLYGKQLAVRELSVEDYTTRFNMSNPSSHFINILPPKGVEAGAHVPIKCDVTTGSIVLEGDRIFMTDHNVLRAAHQAFGWGSKVVGIIDHHADEHKYDSTCVDGPNAMGKDIEVVGSATSLVALQWRRAAAQGDSADADVNAAVSAVGGRAIPSPILLLCPPTMDTSGFKSKKNTAADEQARDYIIPFIIEDSKRWEERLQHEPSEAATIDGYNPSPSQAMKAIIKHFAAEKVGTKGLCDRLKALKDDISGLTVPETLRRDYKRFVLEGDFAVGISAVLLTKKQCRHLYAERRLTARDESEPLPAGAESGVEDEDEADATEDADLLGANNNKGNGDGADGGYPTDTACWLPSIAARMEEHNLNVYMNMFNKKGRELEVVYRSSVAAEFEPAWDYFLQQTDDDVQLRLKDRFKVKGSSPLTAAAAFEYPSSTGVLCGGGTLKQVVYRQKNTGVSRKNFTPFLVDHFAAFAKQKSVSLEELKSDL